MKLEHITPLILTYNEEENIERTLRQLAWAQEVILLDSNSEDRTCEIAGAFENVRISRRDFDTMADQWNYGLSLVRTPWVLSLDADYYVSKELLDEIRSTECGNFDGFAIPFKFCIVGKPLLGSLLPPRVALFQKDKCKYINDGHTQLLECPGSPGQLSNPIYHDDRKSLTRWLNNQKSYIGLEAQKLSTTPAAELNVADRIRKYTPFAPFLVFIYALFVKGALLSGWRGVYYAYQRLFVEGLLAIHLLELRSKKTTGRHARTS